MTENRFEACILMIIRGDRGGLREIYNEYCKIIYSVMLSVVRNNADAEDLTSDFFIKLWEKLSHTYKGGNGHKRWLVTAARNMAIDFLRKNNRMELIIDNTEDDEENSPHIEPHSDENTELSAIGNLTVKEALGRLTAAEREVINLKLFAGFTFNEIASALGMPLGTVSWRYNRALKKLTVYLREVQNDG